MSLGMGVGLLGWFPGVFWSFEGSLQWTLSIVLGLVVMIQYSGGWVWVWCVAVSDLAFSRTL